VLRYGDNFMFVFPCIITLYYIKNQLDATLAVLYIIAYADQPRGLVVRASEYETRGPGFDSRLYHGSFSRRGRMPVVTMLWVVSRFSLKVETSFTRSHKSINND
jgi:hypothetical protein